MNLTCSIQVNREAMSVNIMWSGTCIELYLQTLLTQRLSIKYLVFKDC